MWTSKRTRIAKITLKNNKVGGLTLTDFKSYICSNLLYWRQAGHIGQWNSK